MIALFYIAAAVAVASTALAVTRSDAVHALLYFAVSLLAASVIFFLLGAPFAAVLEVIIYAGAIIVLFIFVVMLAGRSAEDRRREQEMVAPRRWAGPSLMAAILLAELAWVLWSGEAASAGRTEVGPQEVGRTLLGPYLVGVELASMLLLAGLVAAFHLGRRPGGTRGEGS